MATCLKTLRRFGGVRNLGAKIEEMITNSNKAITIPSCCFAREIALCVRVAGITPVLLLIRFSFGLIEGSSLHDCILCGALACKVRRNSTFSKDEDNVGKTEKLCHFRGNEDDSDAFCG